MVVVTDVFVTKDTGWRKPYSNEGYWVEKNNNYTGTQAEAGVRCVDIDECATDAHGCASVVNSAGGCINTVGSYKCECKAGYEYDQAEAKCVDIDECAHTSTNWCDENSYCVDLIGSYKCECKQGYRDNIWGSNYNGFDGGLCEDMMSVLWEELDYVHVQRIHFPRVTALILRVRTNVNATQDMSITLN